MIETQGKKDVITEGLGETRKMGLSKGDYAEAHIIKVLTENYKYPKESHVREAVSNHLDSHVENGNPDQPVKVRLYRDKSGNYILETSDEGLGLSEDEFYKYYMQVGESSKRGKANLIGGKGCGAKAILSYTDNYNVICRKEGIENSFLVFKGELLPESSHVYQKETKEVNGVIVKIVVKSWDISDFKRAIKEQLCYFPTCYFEIEGDTFDYNRAKIFETEDFRWSEMYPDKAMHISFGVCRYPIDWNLLKISQINVPVALKIPIDSGIDVQFNREDLIYNQFAKDYIIEKIKKVADWFVGKYNSSVREFDSFMEAYPYLNNSTHSVTIEGKEFCINSLETHSSIEIATPKVKGISLRDPEFYYIKFENLFEEYSTISHYTRSGMWKKEKLYYYDTNTDRRILNKSKIVLVDDLPVYAVKEFFQKKYGTDTIFIKKSKNRKLFNHTLGFNTFFGYKRLLNLNDYPKSEWRNRIKEYQFIQEQIIKSYVKDGRNIEKTEEFKDFIIQKKAEAKERRKNGIVSGKYKTLNKDREIDITVGKLRKHSYQDSLTIDKGTRKIETLYKTPKLNVWFLKEEFDLIPEKVFTYYTAFSNIDFVILNERETKHIEGKHQFIKIKDLVMSKPFARLSSGILVKRLLDKIPDTKKKYITEQFPYWNDLYDTLHIYYIANYPNRLTPSVENAILEEAAENNVYDENIMSTYHELRKILSKFYFLHLLKDDSYYENEELKKEKKKLVASLLLLQKFHDKDLVLTPAIPVEVEMEMYQIEELITF